MRRYFFLAMALVLASSALAVDYPKKDSPSDPGLGNFIRNSNAMVASGHAFIHRLVCPDGSTPKLESVQLGNNPQGRLVDQYRIKCRNGEVGAFDWADGQSSLPLIPKGFRLKTQKEISKFEIKGRVNEISPAPSGEIWVTTLAGRSYFADSLKGQWKEAPLKVTSQFGSKIERITFLDEKVGIATGYLNGKSYRTEDGGTTWAPVSIIKGVRDMKLVQDALFILSEEEHIYRVKDGSLEEGTDLPRQ